MEKKRFRYDREDMQTDIDWLVEFGMEEEGAREFIEFLLSREKVEEDEI